MGLTKTELFTESQNKISQLAKALGHPGRIAILEHLSQMETCVCGDLVEEIGLAQPTISQHLRELKNVGLIKGNVEGTSVCYCIDSIKWQEMKSILVNFLNQNTNPESQCC